MILAYVYHGMWVAEHKCRHAIALMPCGNSEIEGVDWPKDTARLRCVCGAVEAIQMPSERKKIEEQLNKRPLENRNWYPGETVADLRLENAAHHEELL